MECKWPKEFETTHNNLYRTEKFDKYLIQNRGNGHDVISGLLQAYRLEFPQMYAMKLSKYNSFSDISYNEDSGGVPDNERGFDAVACKMIKER